MESSEHPISPDLPNDLFDTWGNPKEAVYVILQERQRLQCFYCAVEFVDPAVHNLPGRKYRLSTIDHKVPSWRGGCRYDLNNLVLACYKCNQTKSSLTAEEFIHFGLRGRLVKQMRSYLEQIRHAHVLLGRTLGIKPPKLCDLDMINHPPAELPPANGKYRQIRRAKRLAEGKRKPYIEAQHRRPVNIAGDVAVL